MKYEKIGKLLPILSLLLITLIIPLVSAGCAAVNISGITATELAATMVPPVDLDVYIYVNQQVPTKVPSSFTGASTDISVQSLAIWGIANNETQYTVGGALTFTSAADASAVFAQLPKQSDIYTKLSDRTIYVLQGSGGPAASIKNAIDTNNFKRYDDKTALAEVSRLPSGGTTKPGVIGIIKPNKAAVNMVKQYVDQNTASTIDSIFSNAKPRTIALAVLSSQPVDLADMAQRISNNTIWDVDLGVALSMDSVFPGIVFSPIVSRVISNQGFPEVKVGDVIAYKDSVDIGSGRSISIYLNVSGNHVFVTASGKDSYAQTLLTNFTR
jgi:hypothetical protein